MKILLLGATGLVGGHVLERLLADERVSEVLAPVRRSLPLHAKLDAPLVDLVRWPETAGERPLDAVILAFGTTLARAGSKPEFRRVDHDLPLALAGWARECGARRIALTSSAGADAASRFFYLRVKGELEEDLAALGFPSLTFVRPGLIGGERIESRPAERLAQSASGWLSPILPRRLRLHPAPRIAETLVEAALTGRPGVHIVGSRDLA
ncbi:NAD-dependent epimerase/dehydratase family protein [Aureimonas pseudogalii]|uniref:Uncharacterized protein YbjT (DUF2867 family) n=1 Tax=Aureimonas pseudogalii TaxID=1744844 RepID=A0A7W6H470_9HYPH|nr:NAD-dependent epimerase/dehydratase family protein [Aureimonas pseudogalii]MBB3998525.1 uncharacterized protein YbjT (DUF2867 family) [Aureimonas pseudogalii]